MKTFRAVVATFNWFVSLVCGLVGVLWFIGGEKTDYFKLASEHRGLGLTVFIIGLAAVLLNVALVVVRHMWVGPPETHIPVAGPDSDVVIAVSAIRKALTKSLQNQPEVHDAEVEVSHDREARRITRIAARGTIWDGPDALQTSLKIRRLLEKRLLEIIQPESMPEFEVKLDSFRFAQKGKRPRYSSRIDRVTESFRGPQYPIEK